MKRITKEELPDVLTEDLIEILVEMALEDPKKDFAWRDIALFLMDSNWEQYMIISNKIAARRKAIEQAKEDAKSEEQKRAEEEHRRRFYKTMDPKAFYGNMGEPETPQQYKDKYGVWPPGYDENGNKI